MNYVGGGMKTGMQQADTGYNSINKRGSEFKKNA